MFSQTIRYADLAILGGGLAGWALAQALLDKGLPVEQLLLVAACTPGGGASGVPWALMHPLPGRSLYPRPGYLAAWQQSLAWLQSFESAFEAAGAGASPVRSLPVWRMALEQATAGRFARSWQRAQALAESGSLVYPLEQLDPGLWPAALGLYGLQPGRLIQLPALLQRLQQQLRIPFLACQEPVKIQAVSGGWLLQADAHEVHVRQLVLACGSGLADFCPALPLDLSYGEVASFRLNPDPGLTVAISAAGYFIAPLGDGLYHGGATHYAAARPWGLTDVWHSLQAGLAWVPGMAAAQPASVWNGVRCGVRHDREPIVGAAPGYDGLWVMGGFSTRGMLLIPAAASALAEELLTGQAVVPDWMRIARF